MDCVLCKGVIEKGSINYPVDLGEKFILIKDVPAHICSQCGAYYLDDNVFQDVEVIVDHVKSAGFGIEIEVVRYKQSA